MRKAEGAQAINVRGARHLKKNPCNEAAYVYCTSIYITFHKAREKERMGHPIYNGGINVGDSSTILRISKCCSGVDHVAWVVIRNLPQPKRAWKHERKRCKLLIIICNISILAYGISYENAIDL
jgi:hypothetical protein